MPLTITHSTPADGTFSATGATAWNANHSFTVSGTSGELQYNSGGDLAGMSGTSWNDTTRSLTLTGATVTASAPVLDLSQTWNNAAVTFALIRGNATDTASAAGSLLISLQTASVTQFQVDKGGRGRFATDVWLQSDASNRGLFFGSAGDTLIRRRAARNVSFGLDQAVPDAYTISAPNVVAGTTNTAGANFTITGSQGTGTGPGGSIIFQVAPAGASGSSQNALATALTINSARQSVFADGSAAAPSVAFSTESNTGLRLAAAGDFRITVSGFDAVILSQTTLRMQSNAGAISFGSPTADLFVTRDAANTLALRNGGTSGTPVPQTFNIYNFHTDASNYERASIRWASNVLTIGPQALGTGVARAVSFTDGGGTERINIAASSGVVLVADLQLITASSISYIGAGSSGFTLRYSSGSDSNMMVRFAGITSSFPALKRSTTRLQARLADDSAFTNIQGKLTTETNYTAGAPTADGYLVLYDATGTAYKVPCVAL